MRRHAITPGLVLLAAASKLAAAPTSFEWTAPRDCPSAGWIRGRIEALVGQRLSEARQQSLHVKAVVESTPETGYRVTIVGRDENGLRERTLSHTNCQKASEAAALIIALAIDPELVIPDSADGETSVLARPSGSGPSQSDSRPTASKVAAPASPTAPAPEKTRGWLGIGVAASMQIAGGVLPNTAVVARMEGRLEPLPWLVLQAGGAYWFGQTATVEGAFPTSIRPSIALDMWSGGLGICARPIDGSWFFAACTGAELGWMTGIGRNVVAPQRQTDVFWAMLGGVRTGPGLWRIGRATQLRLAMSVEAGSALARPRFGLDGSEYVYRPAVWDWILGVGLELLAKVP
jgi:hypothetical protein